MNKSNEIKLVFKNNGTEIAAEISNEFNMPDVNVLGLVGGNLVHMLIDMGSRGTQLMYEARSLAPVIKHMQFISPSKVQQPFASDKFPLDMIERGLVAEAIMQVRAC